MKCKHSTIRFARTYIYLITYNLSEKMV